MNKTNYQNTKNKNVSERLQGIAEKLALVYVSGRIVTSTKDGHKTGSALRALGLSLFCVCRVFVVLLQKVSSALRALGLSLPFVSKATYIYGNAINPRIGSALRALGLSLSWGGLAFVLIASSFGLSLINTVGVEAAPNQELNFQARLLGASGELIPDGFYNAEFKLYNVSTGGAALWTETYYDSNGVTAGDDNRIRVQNGYLTANLGSTTAFPGTIDWSQQLWITLNIGGTTQTATPTWDGEMNPRLKVTAVPYAFAAETAENVKSTDTNTVSTNSNNVSIATGNASGATSNSGNLVVDTGTATGTTGTISVGSTNASALTLGRAGITTTIQGSVALTGAGTALTVTNNAQFDGNVTIGSDAADTLTVEANATFNGSLTVSAGDQFTNAGSTLLTAITIANDVDGGVLGGTAAATVDIATTFNVNQTTASQTFTLASPTDTTSGRIVYVNNTGSVDLTLEGESVAAGDTVAFIWESVNSAWNPLTNSAEGGVNTLAVIGSSPNANGATISGTTLTLQPADGSFGGVVTTTAQTFAGDKTFSNNLIVTENLTVDTNTLFVDATNDRVGIGTNAPVSRRLDITDGSTVNAGLYYPNTDVLIARQNDQSTLSQVVASSVAGQKASYGGYRSRGTLNTPLAVQNGDSIFSFQAAGYNGTELQTSAGIDFYVDDVPAGSSVPLAIDFVTGTTAGSRSARLTIGSNGNVSVVGSNDFSVGTGATSLGGTLTVTGATTANGLLTANLGATVSGATTSINDSSNFTTNINTGTSTGAVNIGNAAAGAITVQSASTVTLTGVVPNTTQTAGVVVVNTSTGTADRVAGFGVQASFAPSANSDIDVFGIASTPLLTNSNLDTGTASLSGVLSTPTFAFGGTANNLVGISTGTRNAAGGTVRNSYAIQANNPINTGTYVDSVGIAIEQQTVGTTANANLLISSDFNAPAGNYSIYNDSSYDNVFAGDLRIGSTTAPTVALDVTGSALISGTLGVTGATTLNDSLTVGTSSTTNGTVQLLNSTNAFGVTLSASAQTGQSTVISFPDAGANATDTICLATLNNCNNTNAFIQNGNTFGATAVLGTNDGESLVLETNNQAAVTIASGGATIFQNAVDSAAALDVRNSTGTSVLTVNTSTPGGTLTVTGQIAANGGITSPGAGTDSEAFGAGATAAGDRGASLGGNADASGTQSVALGQATVASAQDTIAIGFSADATGSGSTGQGNIAIGSGAQATGSGAFGRPSLAIGFSANSAFQSSIALGAFSTTTAANQLVVGGGNNAINQAYFGNGVTDSSPSAFTLNSTGSSAAGVAGGSLTVRAGAGTTTGAGSTGGILTLQSGNSGGTDIAGANLVVAGGRGTGTGAGGSILFQTATAGSSGAGLNTLVTRFTIANDASTLTGNGATTIAGGSTLGLTSAAASALNITSGTTGALNLDTGTTGAINIGTNANAKTITIGNTTGASATNILSGSGGISLQGNTTIGVSSTDTLTINAGTSGSGISFGNSSFDNCILTTVGGSLTCENQGPAQTPSITLLDEVINTASTTATTGSITPTGNIMYAYVIAADSAGPEPAFDEFVFGGTLSCTWTYVDGFDYAVRRRANLYSCTDFSGSGTVSVTHPAADGAIAMQVFSGQFVNTALGGGSGITGWVESLGSGTAPRSVSITETPNDTDLTVGLIGLENSATLTTGANWSIVSQQGEANHIRQMGLATSSVVDQTAAGWGGWGGSSGYGVAGFIIKGQSQNASKFVDKGDFTYLADTSDELVIGTSTSQNAKLAVVNSAGSSIGLLVNNGASTGNIFELQDASTSIFTIASTGAVTSQNATNSASAFAINNVAGSALLTADTTNYLLKVAPTQFLSSGSTQTFTSGSGCPTCDIAGVDSFSTIAIDADDPSLKINLPVPTFAGTAAVGRVIYVTAVDSSQDFTLVLGGSAIEIAMRENSTATLIWNGTGWTAAGASSSTDLQSAYSNTLTSAGGAEIVLNSSGGAADGLTVRNSDTAPIIGAIFETQTSIGSNLFSVNNNATEYATNGGAETSGGSSSTFPASTWSATPSGGTVSRYTTTGDYIATGLGSVSVVTAATANQGAANQLSQALTPNLRYSVSFAVRGTASASTLDVLYSPDGTNTANVTCAVAQTITQGSWTRINCSFDAPASGITSSNAIFISQSDATARTFYVENLSVTVKADVNHAVDGDVDDTGSFATNWTGATGSETISRNTTTIYNTSGSASVDVTAVGQGVRNNMAITPTSSTQYLVTFYARTASGTTSDLQVRYSRDGGTNFVSCVDYNTQEISSATWARITCLLTTDGVAPTNADLFIDQPTTANDFFVDALSITLNTNTASNVKIGGGSFGGPTTLLTLDRSAGPPVAANNDAYLGSMYYDTVTGRIQCYESGGWGTCGSPPDNIVNLNPEYAGSVLNGTGIGTMTADVCADQSGVLQVNATLCGTGEARNFYQWTSPQSTQQTYSVFITYQLPSTFDGFSNDDTVQLTGRVDSTTNAAVTYEMFRSQSGALTKCGTGETNVATTVDTWQTVGINGNESTGCGFTSASANAFVLFKLNLKAQSNASAYVSTLTFTTTGR